MNRTVVFFFVSMLLCIFLCGFGSAPSSNSLVFNLQAEKNPNFSAEQLAKSKLGHLQSGQYCLKLVDVNVPHGIFSGIEMEFEDKGEPTYDMQSKLVFTILLPSIDKFVD
ncbi:MAG: hypothetical protein WC890_04605 [Candidatus Margulisiibacteriota bacterium]